MTEQSDKCIQLEWFAALPVLAKTNTFPIKVEITKRNTQALDSLMKQATVENMPQYIEETRLQFKVYKQYFLAKHKKCREKMPFGRIA